MGDPLITIIFHHGGSFITEADESMSYNGGETCELPDIDTDTLDVFFVRDYHKKIGYDKVSQTWWLVPNRPMQTGLRAIADDNELMEMCYLAQQNKGVIHVYYEHGVSEPVYIEEAEPVVSGKELMLIPTIIPTPKPTTNATAEPIPSTTPCNPTSEPKNTTESTKPKEPPTSLAAGNRNKAGKISPQPTASLGPKPNPPPKTMAQPSKTKPKIPPKNGPTHCNS